jgi:type IV pilus assembly protein PilV
MSRPRARGYTVVELMMALAVLAIGTTGVIAMQRVVLESNRYAKNLAIATRIAEGWADELDADAQLWTPRANGGGANIPTVGNTDWLNNVNTLTWFRPNFVARRQFGPAFGPLGQTLDPGIQGAQAQFCVDLRLGWIRPEVATASAGTTTTALPRSGNGVIRAQVRVFWPREDVPVTTTGPNASKAMCDPANGPGPDDSNLVFYNVIYLTTTIRETVGQSS